MTLRPDPAFHALRDATALARARHAAEASFTAAALMLARCGSGGRMAAAGKHL